MWLLLLEMLGAFLIFIFIIWWTMFSGRKGGEIAPVELDESGESEQNSHSSLTEEQTPMHSIPASGDNGTPNSKA